MATPTLTRTSRPTTPTSAWQRELTARFFPRRRQSADDSPAALATRLDVRFQRTPALDVVNAAIVHALTTPDARLAISLPPQEGKSTVGTRWGNVWALSRKPSTRSVIASYADNVARRMGRRVRDDIAANSAALGIRVRQDVAAQSEFELVAHGGGVYAVGVGGQLTSRPADLLWIDDPLKDREQAESLAYRDRVWDWWTDVASARLSPGAPVIAILTRWHEDDFVGRVQSLDPGRWTIVNIPAQCEDPATDPLRRAAGEFMVSARGRTRAQWEDRKRTAIASEGSRTWTSLYQGRPTPSEGGLFKKKHLQYYTRVAHPSYGMILRFPTPGGSVRVSYLRDAYRFITTDVAASTRTSADWTVASAWAHTAEDDLVLLDRVRARVTEVDHGALVEPLARKWGVDFVGIEDAGKTVNLATHLGRVGIATRPLKADTDKVTRAMRAAWRSERGGLWMPAVEDAAWVEEFTSELLAFQPDGGGAAHDDQVDTLSYAAMIVAGNALMPVAAAGIDDDVAELTAGLLPPAIEDNTGWHDQQW